MWTGKSRPAGLAILVALAALVLGACGSGGGDTTKPQSPPVSAATAGHLAKLSERVASDLDAGDTCHAAHAADDLRAAVQESDLPASLRPSVDEVAGNLVDQVNCPPPPAPPPEKKPEKPKDEDHGDQHNGDQHQGGDNGPKPPGDGGKLPPGKAKLKGEPG
ncbi:MAG: hypothetical protein WA696_12330 [Solirubrobacterales bacterium]